jgi:hypothetical protein
MEQSILKSTKKILGVGVDDDSFDLDIITHINTAFSTLQQLGVGPETGFVIEDDSTEWGDFLDPTAEKVKLSQAKTVVYLRTRLLFDPPTSAYLLDAAQIGDGETHWVDLPYMGALDDVTPTSDAALYAHIQSTTPHPAYDDSPSFALLYQNAKV